MMENLIMFQHEPNLCIWIHFELPAIVLDVAALLAILSAGVAFVCGSPQQPSALILVHSERAPLNASRRDVDVAGLGRREVVALVHLTAIGKV
ncbi:hypothetical protein Mapa_017089 [Marchantia paleacea]|nr:hypothetical protein Mapa_017089 [Marchantia paleacea]